MEKYREKSINLLSVGFPPKWLEYGGYFVNYMHLLFNFTKIRRNNEGEFVKCCTVCSEKG